ncbi:hypothetical protein MUK42_15048 [Musa troglodytarum]|uniref:Uncharacterized protein n=1 Tax=Musa troglodytarum TaxID=320322 RepID=A0A9E7L6Y2_9LILI|nr:hypothetical protein MUK42_15048 [Musa troglodytarum]
MDGKDGLMVSLCEGRVPNRVTWNRRCGPIAVPESPFLIWGSRGKGPRAWGGSSFLYCHPSPVRFCLLILARFASRGVLQSSLIEE